MRVWTGGGRNNSELYEVLVFGLLVLFRTLLQLCFEFGL